MLGVVTATQVSLRGVRVRGPVCASKWDLTKLNNSTGVLVCPLACFCGANTQLGIILSSQWFNSEIPKCSLVVFKPPMPGAPYLSAAHI